MSRSAFLLSLFVLLTSCASTARVTGDFDDYRSYRRTRLAATLEERLGAGQRYLREFPRGDYRDEVRAWFLPAEKRYFKLSWNNLPRLRAYLDVMPDGRYAEAAADRITELQSRRVYADRREQRVLDVAQGFETRLAKAAEQRREFLREFSTFVRLLGATRTFGEPTSELDSELLLRFRVHQPSGTCDGDLCRKLFSFPYAVPDGKLLASRDAQLTLEITLDRGLVLGLALSGPELLTRVAEARETRAVPERNPQARAEALGHALDVVAEALDGPLPKSRCEIDVVSPMVLARRCDGVLLQVVAGTESGAPDRLFVTVARP
ncbi:MAG: hypothetical protein ABI488_20495 [Polyangiaceae bacterium]